MKHLHALAFLLITGALIISCASNPYGPTNRAHKKQIKTLSKELKRTPLPVAGTPTLINYANDWVGTTNFSLRRPNVVVIHHTAQDSVEQTLRTFTLPRTQVSSHYVIGKNGEVYQMLNDLYRAWHGGNGQWGSNTDLNSASIGIELDNNGFTEFSGPQIASLLELLKELKEKYNIPTANFIGHADIAPTRKNDPNRTFPWRLLAKEGYGHWYDEPIYDTISPLEETPILRPDASSAIAHSKNDSLDNNAINPYLKYYPLDVPPEVALKIIGYDVTDLPAAIKAFKLHFIQTEVDTNLTEHDLRVLNNLYKKYL